MIKKLVIMMLLFIPLISFSQQNVNAKHLRVQDDARFYDVMETLDTVRHKNLGDSLTGYVVTMDDDGNLYKVDTSDLPGGAGTSGADTTKHHTTGWGLDGDYYNVTTAEQWLVDSGEVASHYYVSGMASDAILFASFPAVIIRNLEENNLHTDSNDTRYVVTAHNTTDDYVVLNYPAPIKEGLVDLDTTYGPHRWGFYTAYATLIDVDSLSATRDTIWYSQYITGTGSIVAGDSGVFFDPYQNSVYWTRDALLDASTLSPACDYVAPGGVWQHSDGTYRMIVNGWVTSTSKYRPWLASSSDLQTWSYVSTSPYYQAGTDPFDETYISSGGHLFFTANPQKLNGSDSLYVATFTCNKNGTSYMTVGICVFDEDFDVKWVSDTTIKPAGISYNYGWTAGGISYHKGHYYLSFCDRPTSSTSNYDYVPYEIQLGDLFSLECLDVKQILDVTAQDTWNGRHIDQCSPLVYNGELYYMVGGTGLYRTETMLGYNRSFGMIKKTEHGFVQNPANPVLVSPIEGEYVWGTDLLWATDHMGGYYSYWADGGYLYNFLSAENGSDTYKVYGVRTTLVDVPQEVTQVSDMVYDMGLDDHEANGSKITVSNGNAGGVAFGDVCYVASDGDMEFADADASTTMPGLLMAIQTISAGSSGRWLSRGIARDDTWNWTPGSYIYISTTATTGNTLTSTAPSGSGDQVQIVGVAISADIILFDPQLVTAEID